MKIVIASVLKPIDDTRMTEKIGKTIAGLPNTEVIVIGFPTSAGEVDIGTIALNRFNRLSFERLFSPWRILIHVLRISPKVFIVATHELLLVALLVRAFTGCKLIYDVQENYYRNIKFTKSFPPIIRGVLALYVRAKEVLTSPFVHHYFLAEKAYAFELNFINRKFTVVENKVVRPKSIDTVPRDPYALLFSGTLADSTGVFVAINIVDKLHELDPRFSLTIIGFCAKKEELLRLNRELSKKPFIQLIGGDRLIPHSQIADSVAKSGFGIISYLESPSTAGSIPTKLYEYLGFRLPILLTKHPVWQSICAPFNAAYPFDPERLAPREIIEWIKQGHFYTSSPEFVYWDSEAPKLLTVLKALLGFTKE